MWYQTISPRSIAVIGLWMLSIQAALGQYARIVLADHPVAYYRLNEAPGATIAVDSAGNGNNGLYEGNPILGVPGLIQGSDTAVDFTNGDVVILDTAQLNFVSAPYTLEAWIRGTPLPEANAARIFDKAIAGTDMGYGYDVELNYVRMFGANPTGNFDTTIPLPSNATNHVVVVSTGTGIGLIYVNGALAASGPQIASKPYTGPAHIAVASDGTAHFTGIIDDVAVYNYALTAAQILAHFKAGTDGCQVNACGPGVTDNCVGLTVGAKIGWPPQTSMDAVFIPPSGMTVANFAHSCGFAELNWQQIVEFVPAPSPFQEVGIPPGFNPIPLTAGFGVTFFDPPPRGYVVPNDPSSAYPFYYDATELALNPIVCASNQVEGALNVPTNALCFHDAPADPCLQGGDKDLQTTYCGGNAAQTGAALLFKTELVGVSQTVPSGMVLHNWEWLDNFNGTADGFIVTVRNPGPVDPGSGTGGITITSINGVPQTPPSVSCAATPNTLWPPNGKSVSVTVSGSITAGTSALVPSKTTFAVADSQREVQPSGPTAVGSDGAYAFTIPLVASREGNDRNGRRYTATVTATDNIENVGSCSVLVTVPHDQGH